MFRYRRNSEGTFDNLDDLGGYPVREQDIQTLRDNNIPFEIVDDAALTKSFEDEYGELLIDELVKDGRAHLKTIDQEIARQALIRKQVEELKPLQAALQDADTYLTRDKVNTELLRGAGVGKEFSKNPDAKRNRRLAGNIPAPILVSIGNMDRRVHTKYENNPVTGELEVVPFRNPDRPEEVLVTDLGMHKQLPEGHEIANEYVQQNILRLMDEGITKQNNRVKGKEHRADFVRQVAGGNRKTEGMVRKLGGNFFNSNVAIPSHTAIVPIGERITDDNEMRDYVKDLIKREMKGRVRRSSIQATENLIDKGVLGYDTGHRYGKLLRSDPNRVKPDEVYDELIVTGHPKELMEDAAFKTDKWAEAPVTIHLAEDLNKVRRFADKPSMPMTVTPNRGQDDHGELRAKVQSIVPIDAKAGNQQLFTDLTVTHPYTQQLLQQLPYI